MMQACVLAVAACFASGVTASAETIDVQFACDTGCNGSPAPGGSTLPQTGAAVIGAPGDTWNQAISNGGGGATGTNLALVDTTGASTGVSLTWSAVTEWNEADASHAFNDTAFNGTPYQNLMGSYLVADPSDSASLEITGLTAGGAYEMYFYSQANQDTDGRIADFDVNGVNVSTLQGTCGVTPDCPDTLNTFVLGENYTLADVVADSNGDINVGITVPGEQTYEGDVNGFQLVGGGSASTPEPGTAGLMLLALGAGASLLRRRRQSR